MNEQKQAIITEAAIQMEDHPSKDARWFAKSVHEYLMAEQSQSLPFGVGGGLVAIKTLLSRDPCVHANTAIEMIDAILAGQSAHDEPLAWMYPDDMERMKTSETFCTVYSVEVGSPTRGESSVALYTAPFNLNCKSTQARLAASWGYVKAQT